MATAYKVVDGAYLGIRVPSHDYGIGNEVVNTQGPGLNAFPSLAHARQATIWLSARNPGCRIVRLDYDDPADVNRQFGKWVDLSRCDVDGEETV